MYALYDMFTVGACLVFVASTECKIGLLCSLAIHIKVTTCDTCGVDDVVRNPQPFPSVFAYCKCSKTGVRNEASAHGNLGLPTINGRLLTGGTTFNMDSALRAKRQHVLQYVILSYHW